MTTFSRGWVFIAVRRYGIQGEEATYTSPLYETRDTAEAAASEYLHPQMNSIGLRVLVVEASEANISSPLGLGLGMRGL